MGDTPDVPYVGYKKPKHFGYIEIKTPEGSVYMRRWYLFRCSLFSVRLHHIRRPDLDVWPHNHPWSFFSIILCGGYNEEWCPKEEFRFGMIDPLGGSSGWIDFRRKMVTRFNFKRYTDLHKIASFHRGSESGAWTLIFTGPERQVWGFMTDQGFFTHKELGVGDTTPYQTEPD